jgi:hypothetical protein
MVKRMQEKSNYQFFFPPSFPAFFSFNTNTTSVKQPICPVSKILNEPERRVESL